jgi:phosphoribosyl 1,2-cyclic phosphodiesterase
MRFCLLASGSQGNALVVEAGRTRLLLDCGLSLSDIDRRMAQRGLAPDALDGVLVTHEHDDHLAGVARLARRHALPVWLTPGTLRGLEGLFEAVELQRIEGYTALCIGDLEVHPYPVPHDAREPAQFVFHDGVHRLGVLTDAGHATPLMQRMLDACDALVLECNHDPQLLLASTYPETVKQRIVGRFGHLDNAASGALLATLEQGRLRHVVAAHLSQANNRPDLARAALANALNCSADWIAVASQDDGLDWREMG